MSEALTPYRIAVPDDPDDFVGGYRMTCKYDPSTDFGRRLREYRARAGVSQGRIASLVSCDHSFISYLESGGRQPSREMAVAICDALDLAGYDRERLLNAAGHTETQWSRDAWQLQQDAA